jgi:hypothetical protein
MVGCYHGVGAVPFRLWREREDEHAANEPSERRYQQQEPQVKRMVPYDEPCKRRLAARMWFRVVAGQGTQSVVLHKPRGNVEGDCADPGHDAHHRREPEHPDLTSNAFATETRDLGEPAGKSPQRRQTSQTSFHGSYCVLVCLLEFF